MDNLITSVIDNFTSIAATLLMAALFAYFTWRNNYKTRHATACAEFRTAFNDAMLRLTASSEATSIIIFQNHNGHLAAIFAFKPYVAWYRRRGFERAAKEYSLQASIQKVKDPFEALVLDFTREAQAQRAALLAAVQKLLTYASAT